MSFQLNVGLIKFTV